MFFRDWNPLVRIFMMGVSTALYKYHFVRSLRVTRILSDWALFQCLAGAIGEAGAALAGMGMDATTKEWNQLRSSNLLCIELPTNVRCGINGWNMKVSTWLNTCKYARSRYITQSSPMRCLDVYRRVGLSKSGKSTTISTIATFLVSAVWHVRICVIRKLRESSFTPC